MAVRGVSATIIPRLAQLVYAPAYLALMTVAPVLIVAALAAALWLGRRRSRA